MISVSGLHSVDIKVDRKEMLKLLVLCEQMGIKYDLKEIK